MNNRESKEGLSFKREHESHELILELVLRRTRERAGEGDTQEKSVIYPTWVNLLGTLL